MKARKQKTPREIVVSWLIIFAVVTVAVTPIIWTKCIKYQILPKNFGPVIEGRIYRSGQNHARVLGELCDDLELNTIIDLGGEGCEEPENPRTVEQRQTAADKGVTRYSFRLPGDGRGDPNKWAAVLRIMSDPENEPMLVHCSAGAQRTTTAILLYQLVVEGKPIQETYPESFNFKHKPDEWELLAFLADNLEKIREAYYTDMPTGDADFDSITDLLQAYRNNNPVEGQEKDQQ